MEVEMRIVVASVLCLFALAHAPVIAQEGGDPFAIEEELLFKLRRAGMPGYLEIQLRLLRRDFPGRREDLQFLNAVTRPSRSEKRRLLEQIPKTSRRYRHALWELAKATPKPDAKAVVLRKLMDLLKDAPDAEAQDLRNRAGHQLLSALIAAKKEVPEDLLVKLIKDKRIRAFWLAKTKLNRADKLHDSENREDRKEVGKLAGDALRILTKDSDLMWQPDYWNAMAYIEAGRAHFLRGDLKAAVTSLETVYNNGTLTRIEREIRQNRGDVARLSPLAPTYYYLARIRLAEAQKIAGQQDQKKQRKKLLAESLKLFFRVEREYGGHEYEAEAIAGFDQVAGILRKDFQVTVKRPKLPSQRIYEMGLACYQNEDWEKAFGLFTKVAQRNYSSQGAANALFYATACMYKLDRHLEAQAMAELMADVQPKSPRTHDMLSLASSQIWAAAQSLKSGPVRSAYEAGVMRLYERLLKLAPEHPRAPTAAKHLASNRLEQAKTRKEEVNLLRQQKGKDSETHRRELGQATHDMHAAYLKAAEAYTTIVKAYPRTSQATSAYFSLGYIHSVLGSRMEATSSYLEHVDRERRPTPWKLLAKMYAAQHLSSLGKHETAHTHWQDILDWSESDKYDRQNPHVARAVKAARAMAPQARNEIAKEKLNRAEELEKQAEGIDQQIKLLEQELQD
jgi:TolA-binding protein